MRIRTVIDGNAFYEIDEDCLEERRRKQEREKNRESTESGTGQSRMAGQKEKNLRKQQGKEQR